MQARPWLVAILCVVLAGCSATRLVYNQLDWGLVWYLNRYFTLDDEQDAALRESVARNLEWHRTTQLPGYAQFFRGLIEELDGDVTPEMLDRRYDEIIAFWDEFVVHITPDVAAFFALLDQSQIDEFLENMEEENSDLWDEYAGETPEERQERRRKAALKGIRRTIGRLDAEQKELINAYLDTMVDVADEWMEGRRIWQQEFVDLMKSRPPEPEFSDRLTNLMIDPNQFDDPAYRRTVEQNRWIVLEMMADLFNQMDEKQSARASNRLGRYARDFEILSSQ